jgi:hypothetical protein
MAMPSSSASRCNSHFHKRTREPLLPPSSAVISSRFAKGLAHTADVLPRAAGQPSLGIDAIHFAIDDEIVHRGGAPTSTPVRSGAQDEQESTTFRRGPRPHNDEASGNA